MECLTGRVDLHIHTSYSSDGDHSPNEILQMAQALGLRAIAITDHDTVEGSELALAYAADFDVEVIPAVEITSFSAGRELHVLGYFIDNAAIGLLQQLAHIRECDDKRMREVTTRLQEIGIDVSYDEATMFSPNAVPKCSVVMKAAMTNGRNIGLPLLEPYLNGPRSDQPYHNFFLDYMRPGGPAYVEPLVRYSTQDAIQLILSHRGVPVLAHAGGSLALPQESSILDSLGPTLAGLEVYSSYHTEFQERFLLSYCSRNRLAVTAGSDFHGSTVKPTIQMGKCQRSSYELIEGLRRARHALHGVLA
jgi:hypothetical protein